MVEEVQVFLNLSIIFEYNLPWSAYGILLLGEITNTVLGNSPVPVLYTNINDINHKAFV